MDDIVISGIGQLPAGEHWDVSLRELGSAAVRAAIANAGNPKPQALFVANMLSMNISNQAHLATLIADRADLTGIEAVTVEGSGASGGLAIRQAVMAVRSGFVDHAVVLGVEKFSDKAGVELEAALATNMDGDYESMQGLTVSSQAALLMQLYMARYNVEPGGFAGFAVNAHRNGEGNTNAMFQKEIKPETYLRAEMISEPLNMFDAAPNADGAAAIVITRRNLAQGINAPITISGGAISSDTLALHDRVDPLEFRAIARSARMALEQAEMTADQMSLFEYHDQFSIFAALSIEASGFCLPGEGWKFGRDNQLGPSGKLPCGTMGGHKARGFTGGAAGVYQAVEAVQQLLSQAGSNQVANASHAMIQSIGGPGSVCATHILSK